LFTIKSGRVLATSLVVSALLMGMSPASAALFTIDNFKITRVNGNLVFQDTFSDGVPPPSAPNFTNGNPGSYSVTGIAGPESGGKLNLNTALGAPSEAVGRPGQNRVIDARLLTNIDPTNMTNGFKVGNDLLSVDCSIYRCCPLFPEKGLEFVCPTVDSPLLVTTFSI